MSDPKKGKEKPSSSKKNAEKLSSEPPESSKRELDFARRQLIRAGWTVPVIMVVKPQNVFAQSPAAHGDTTGTHADAPTVAHGDIPPHADAPHADIVGAHFDIAHTDSLASHNDSPLIGPHSDTPAPHTDA